MNPLIVQILFSVLTGLAVGAGVWALFGVPATVETATHRRFALAVGAEKRDTLFELPALAPLTSLALRLARALHVASLREMIRAQLDASGNPSNYSVDEYLALCLLTGAGLAAAAALIESMLIGGVDPFSMTLMAVLGAAGPILTLRSAARNRVLRISKALPFSLDLVALIMAAGSSFTEAVDTLIRDNPEDDFNQEMRIVRAEIDLGAKRSEALSHMADRIPLETLRSVVGAVNQAEALGTPLSDILKNQSGMMRMHRSVRAEKLSASASLYILIPSMLILLAVMLVVLGPLIIKVLTTGLFA